jgi:serine/threonine protein kinase
MAKLSIDMVQGLRALHASELFHGDIKPHNIIAQAHEERQIIAKLADFAGSANLSLENECSGPLMHSSAPKCLFMHVKWIGRLPMSIPLAWFLRASGSHNTPLVLLDASWNLIAPVTPNTLIPRQGLQMLAIKTMPSKSGAGVVQRALTQRVSQTFAEFLGPKVLRGDSERVSSDTGASEEFDQRYRSRIRT